MVHTVVYTSEHYTMVDYFLLGLVEKSLVVRVHLAGACKERGVERGDERSGEEKSREESGERRGLERRGRTS